MSVEAVPEVAHQLARYTDYAEQVWLGELVRLQNENTPLHNPIILHASLQQRCAESLIQELENKPYFQKFGGQALSIFMAPTSEPYMYNVGLGAASFDKQ